MDSKELIKYEFGIVVLLVVSILALVVTGYGESASVQQFLTLASLLVSAVLGFAHASGSTQAMNREADTRITKATEEADKRVNRVVETLTGPLSEKHLPKEEK